MNQFARSGPFLCLLIARWRERGGFGAQGQCTPKGVQIGSFSYLANKARYLMPPQELAF